MYVTKIFGWIIALRWEVKIWWRNVWTSRQLAGYIQNFHRTMLNDRRHWKLKSFWSLGCPIWFSYFWMLPIGMFNLLLEEAKKIQQRWQQKRETALNAKKIVLGVQRRKFGFSHLSSWCLKKKLQFIFECSGYKTERRYLSCGRLTGRLVTFQVILSCTFLQWVQRHTSWVWPDRGSYFGERYSSRNTHAETKGALRPVKTYQKGTTRYLPYPNSAKRARYSSYMWSLT